MRLPKQGVRDLSSIVAPRPKMYEEPAARFECKKGKHTFKHVTYFLMWVCS